jgi:hypothetical protein
VPCDREKALRLKGVVQEILETENQANGKSMHLAFYSGIKSGNWTELERITEHTPKNLPPFQSQWDEEFAGGFLMGEDSVRYKIDKVLVLPNGDLLIVDCKSAYLYDVSELYQKQLRYYAYALLDINPLDKIHTAIYSAPRGWLLYGETYDGSSMGMLKNEIARDITLAKEVMGKEHNYINPSAWCNWCNHPLSCNSPLKGENRDIIIQEWLRSKAQASASENLVKALCEKEGIITFGDKQIGNFDSTKTTVDTMAFVNSLNSLEKVKEYVDKKVLTCNITNFKKILKKDETLSQYAGVELTTRFGLKEIKE